MEADATEGNAMGVGGTPSFLIRKQKSIQAWTAYIDIDVPTLIWTRGRDFPIARLETRMKCPRCGSRRVLVAFEPAENEARQRHRGVA
jgi:hypothetical protein